MKRIRLFLDKLVNLLVIACVIGMVAVIFLQVIFRFVLNDPLSWSEELARFLFVWITFLGAAICARERAHIGMDYVVSKFPEALRKRIEHFEMLLLVVISLAIMVTSIETVVTNFGQSSPALKLNMGLVYAAIPIGCAYTAVYYFEHFMGLIAPKKQIERSE